MNNKLKTTITEILRDTGHVSEEQVLKDHARLIALAKISKYQAETRKYKNKYNTDFEKFENDLLQQKNQEDFEKEDDYLDWKFAEEALSIWKKRNEILSDA